EYPRMGEKIVELERQLAEKSDLCFATAHSLVEHLKRYNPKTFLAPHGVDHEHFARALRSDTVVPQDAAALPRPIIGFIGGIHEWVDFELIGKLAAAHPDWSLALIGELKVEPAELRRYANVHFLGRRAYKELPSYCKSFSAGIIPYVVNDSTKN